MSDAPAWQQALINYSEAEIADLEHAVEHQVERIEKAARDLANTGVVDGIDIGELWFAVLRRREELATETEEPAAPKRTRAKKAAEPVPETETTEETSEETSEEEPNEKTSEETAE